MLLVNFLTFIGKILIFMYMAFILIPLAVLYALATMCWVFLQWVWEISIIKKKTNG